VLTQPKGGASYCPSNRSNDFSGLMVDMIFIMEEEIIQENMAVYPLIFTIESTGFIIKFKIISNTSGFLRHRVNAG
jgi:hypothetical protein